MQEQYLSLPAQVQKLELTSFQFVSVSMKLFLKQGSRYMSKSLGKRTCSHHLHEPYHMRNFNRRKEPCNAEILQNMSKNRGKNRGEEELFSSK
jgi:hypothetical protein